MTSDRTDIDVDLLIENGTRLVNQLNSNETPMDISEDTSNTGKWSASERSTLEKWLIYHQESTLFVDHLKLGGNASIEDMPKPPKEKLQPLLDKNWGKSKPVLTGKDLHKFLEQNLVHVAGQKFTTPCVKSNDSLEDAKSKLASLSEMTKRRNAQCLKSYMLFGKSFQEAYNTFELDKLRGNISGTWKEWVQQNLPIGYTQAKKYQNLAEKFGMYQRFNNLGLSLREFEKHEKAIVLMFHEFPDLKNYWKKPLLTVTK